MKFLTIVFLKSHGFRFVLSKQYSLKTKVFLKIIIFLGLSDPFNVGKNLVMAINTRKWQKKKERGSAI